MKHLISLIVGVAFLFSFQLNGYSAESVKIAVVDLQKLRKNSVAFQKFAESFAKKLEPQKKELEQMQAGLIALREDLQKQSMMLSLGAKVDKQKEMGKKERRLEYLMKEYRQEGQFIEMEMSRNLSSDLIRVVGEIGKNKKYTVILEKGSSGLLYSSESIDITDQVTKAYDQMKQ